MSPLECPSRIDRVVLYARGAVVTRRITLPEELPADAFDLRVPGITPLAQPGSGRALVDGDREVTALLARAAIPAAPVKPGHLFEEVRALRLARQRIEAELRERTARRQQLASLAIAPRLSRWSRRDDPAARFGDALALGGLVGEEIARLDGVLADLEQSLADNQRRLRAAELDAAQGSTAEIAGADRPSLEVILRLGAAAELRALSIEYLVTAARWWPAYTARLSAAATKVTLTVDAFVAQATGEDWSGVRLAVSSADLAQDARLPELRSLRIGRAQPPSKKGYRPPPAGLEAMFEGHDRALEKLAPPPDDLRTLTGGFAAPPPPPQQQEHAAEGAREKSHPEEQTRTRAGVIMPQSYGAPPGNMPFQAAPASMAMPRPAAAAPMRLEVGRAKSAGIGGIFRRSEAEYALEEALDLPAGGGGGVATRQPAEPLGIEPEEGWFDFDVLTLADPVEDRDHRGRLVRVPEPQAGARAAALRLLANLPGPEQTRDPLETRGRFDHRWDAEGTADVPSNALPHRVTITSAGASSRPRFVAVPREAAEVYREAEIKNPFAAPLLSGPVDVFLDGALLTTSALEMVDRGGTMHLGLGVEERLRVARNARVEEGSAGLLGGSTTVEHTVTIDVASSLGHKVDVDVLDRVPVTDEKDVEVKRLYARPEAAKYTQAERGDPIQGGLSWRISVAPGEKQRLEFAYRVTLPARNEIVGGNRRE